MNLKAVRSVWGFVYVMKMSHLAMSYIFIYQAANLWGPDRLHTKSASLGRHHAQVLII